MDRRGYPEIIQPDHHGGFGFETGQRIYSSENSALVQVMIFRQPGQDRAIIGIIIVSLFIGL